MPETLKSNEFWGKKFGSYSEIKPKGSMVPWGYVIDIKRGSGTSRKGGSHSGLSGYKLRWYKERVLKPVKLKKG